MDKRIWSLWHLIQLKNLLLWIAKERQTYLALGIISNTVFVLNNSQPYQRAGFYNHLPLRISNLLGLLCLVILLELQKCTDLFPMNQMISWKGPCVVWSPPPSQEAVPAASLLQPPAEASGTSHIHLCRSLEGTFFPSPGNFLWLGFWVGVFDDFPTPNPRLRL